MEAGNGNAKVGKQGERGDDKDRVGNKRVLMRVEQRIRVMMRVEQEMRVLMSEGKGM
jgi:hypothetical protein